MLNIFFNLALILIGGLLFLILFYIGHGLTKVALALSDLNITLRSQKKSVTELVANLN